MLIKNNTKNRLIKTNFIKIQIYDPKDKGLMYTSINFKKWGVLQFIKIYFFFYLKK